MVFFKSFVVAAALSGVAFALPRPQDSALGIEVAVSAPNGVPLTDLVELASQSAFEAGQAAATAAAETTSTTPEAQPTPVDNSYNNGGEWQQPPQQYAGGEWQQPPQHENVDTWSASPSTSSWVSYSTPAYGSGHSNWGGSGYDDCVNQCIASYGAPPASYHPTPTSGHEGPVGTGATHTVIVAPSQGVLRYVPYAVNASVGDTVKFMWGANNHTVTRGTQLTPCNRSEENFFASGLQIKDFVFTQVINDTNPIYFYCAAPNHCQQGMFGVINPRTSFGSPTSASAMMQPLSESHPDVAAYAAWSRTQTEGNEAASRWGSNIDMADTPEWAQPFVAENIMYTRNFLAANKEVLREDGTIDLSSAESTPLMIPQDIGAALNNADASAAPSTPEANANTNASASSDAPAASGTPAADTDSANATSGALGMSSSRILVGAAVAFATFFAF
ncbi:hypothetical protein AX16_003641 [Volvariella volvacea WC 439]|nr:hypothetical protein AX16_003641 [Volvariella volvacea WC 439]